MKLSEITSKEKALEAGGKLWEKPGKPYRVYLPAEVLSQELHIEGTTHLLGNYSVRYLRKKALPMGVAKRLALDVLGTDIYFDGETEKLSIFLSGTLLRKLIDGRPILLTTKEVIAEGGFPICQHCSFFRTIGLPPSEEPYCCFHRRHTVPETFCVDGLFDVTDTAHEFYFPEPFPTGD